MLQREELLRVFEEYICDSYGMRKRSAFQENLVYDDMVMKLRRIDEAYDIEKKISEKEIELKRLKTDLAKNRMLMSKSLNASRRNYPVGIFNACVCVLRKAQDITMSVSAKEFVKHKPLIRLEGKAIVKESVKRRYNYRSRVKVIRKYDCDGVKMKNNSKVNEVIERVVPNWEWKKPGEITVTVRTDEKDEMKVFEFYEPSITPNPMQRFLKRVAG